MSTKTTQQIPSLLEASSVVHCVGSEAGMIRVNCEFPPSTSIESVRPHVSIQIPGETVYLESTEVIGEDGRYIFGFFSSDIANSGHVPASLTVHWLDDSGATEIGEASITNAAAVKDSQAEDLARVPGGKPLTSYPRTVGIMPIALLAIAIVFITAVLLANLN